MSSSSESQIALRGGTHARTERERGEREREREREKETERERQREREAKLVVANIVALFLLCLFVCATQQPVCQSAEIYCKL